MDTLYLSMRRSVSQSGGSADERSVPQPRSSSTRRLRFVVLPTQRDRGGHPEHGNAGFRALPPWDHRVRYSAPNAILRQWSSGRKGDREVRLILADVPLIMTRPRSQPPVRRAHRRPASSLPRPTHARHRHVQRLQHRSARPIPLNIIFAQLLLQVKPRSVSPRSVSLRVIRDSRQRRLAVTSSPRARLDPFTDLMLASSALGSRVP